MLVVLDNVDKLPQDVFRIFGRRLEDLVDQNLNIRFLSSENLCFSKLGYKLKEFEYPEESKSNEKCSHACNIHCDAYSGDFSFGSSNDDSKDDE